MIRKTVSLLFVTALMASAGRSYAQNTIVMKSGEKVNCKVDGLANGMINYTSNGTPKKIGTTEVTAIYFDGSSANATEAKPADNGQKTVSLSPKEKTVTAGSTIVRYLVNERTIIKEPTISNLTRERGTIVVNVSIDRYGNIKSAEPTANGSTSKSEYLITKAKQAVQSIKFNADNTAPIEEKGYVIIPY
ncbi:MAG: hypothetical protein WCL14_12830 [Bacteroidota bacterium]